MRSAFKQSQTSCFTGTHLVRVAFIVLAPTDQSLDQYHFCCCCGHLRWREERRGVELTCHSPLQLLAGVEAGSHRLRMLMSLILTEKREERRQGERERRERTAEGEEDDRRPFSPAAGSLWAQSCRKMERREGEGLGGCLDERRKE
ncbi:hypothetical protein H5410_002357 [Solanum commersonii]|uniref:Uncharacterized protein n=1 Tax=Solanum commersonii TaxID=4109 RepID=A0A9J6B1U1_SOLCO|nr:hypothetical protein H5410_002357 [Solanum commersonii]